MIRSLSLGVLIALAACTRPLTTSEEQFAGDLFGPSLDLSEVRIAQGLGISPPVKSVPAKEARVLTGTDQAYRPPGHTLKGGRRAKATGDYEPWTPG